MSERVPDRPQINHPSGPTAKLAVNFCDSYPEEHLRALGTFWYRTDTKPLLNVLGTRREMRVNGPMPSGSKLQEAYIGEYETRGHPRSWGVRQIYSPGELRRDHGLRVIELDKVFWRPGLVAIPRDQWAVQESLSRKTDGLWMVTSGRMMSLSPAACGGHDHFFGLLVRPLCLPNHTTIARAC
jgi:hypothetical protein